MEKCSCCLKQFGDTNGEPWVKKSLTGIAALTGNAPTITQLLTEIDHTYTPFNFLQPSVIDKLLRQVFTNLDCPCRTNTSGLLSTKLVREGQQTDILSRHPVPCSA